MACALNDQVAVHAARTPRRSTRSGVPEYNGLRKRPVARAQRDADGPSVIGTPARPARRGAAVQPNAQHAPALGPRREPRRRAGYPPCPSHWRPHCLQTRGGRARKADPTKRSEGEREHMGAAGARTPARLGYRCRRLAFGSRWWVAVRPTSPGWRSGFGWRRRGVGGEGSATSPTGAGGGCASRRRRPWPRWLRRTGRGRMRLGRS